jgi:bifunctional UDP-N-acetylglucosamine pyrophosphorylase/glucosamine-1-phosphate N-acetyltransferase
MIKAMILAAGQGTRMKSQHPKVMHKICGETLLGWVGRAAAAAGAEETIVIIGHGKDEILKAYEGSPWNFADQPIGEGVPYGTGYAVMQGMDMIQDEDQVLVLTGDTPLLEGDDLKALLDKHRSTEAAATVLSAKMDDPTGYGRILRDQAGVVGIVEEKDASESQRAIQEINSGIFCFQGHALKEALGALTTDNAQGEYYLTDTLEILRGFGKTVESYCMEKPDHIRGINSRVQLAQAAKIRQARINEAWMLEGVTLIDPESTYIDADVVIGQDTVIEPNVQIKGASVIGSFVEIGSMSKIINSEIGNEVTIDSSKIIDSQVGSKTTVGPYAYLRPKSRIGEGCRIGDFVEVKNAMIGNGSKASHLSYVGDAIVGERVNIGCGVVFVNYDGKKKSQSIVEDDAFIGSNANLVAPVHVKKKGFVAAGSTITRDVEEGDLSIARAKQVNKAGWAERFFNK